jgi:hypothetical protein
MVKVASQGTEKIAMDWSNKNVYRILMVKVASWRTEKVMGE